LWHYIEKKGCIGLNSLEKQADSLSLVCRTPRGIASADELNGLRHEGSGVSPIKAPTTPVAGDYEEVQGKSTFDDY
jgi:hypothetical protein